MKRKYNSAEGHIDLEETYKEALQTATKLEKILDGMVKSYDKLNEKEIYEEKGQKLLTKMNFIYSALNSAISVCESLIPFNKEQSIAIREVSRLGSIELPPNILESIDTVLESIMDIGQQNPTMSMDADLYN